MAALLLPSARLLTPSHFTVCRRIRWLCSSVQRCYKSDTPASSADHLSSGLEKYKDLQKYFRRRLKGMYQKFSSIPDHSVISGHHHLYVIENDGIYRLNKRQSDRQPEQVLDLGQISGGEEDKERMTRFHWTVQRIRLSPQEKHLAATLKCGRRGEIRCVVLRLEEERSLPQRSHHMVTLEKVFSFEWATDETLFYTTLEGVRSHMVFRLDLTPSGSRTACVYEETQPDVFVEVALSRDRHILTINCNSRTSSEVHISALTTSHLEPFVVKPRQLDLLYHVEHWKQQLIILTNTGPAQEYEVVKALFSDSSVSSWISFFRPDPGTVIKDMDVVGDHCVLTARTPANELVLIIVPLIEPKDAYVLQLPSWACAIETGTPDWADQQNVMEFLISSPVRPPELYCLYPDQGLLLSGSAGGSSSENRASYTTTRLEACSQDGTWVPVTLFHAVPVESLRKAPLLVHVYGAYGRDVNMDFCPERRLLLEGGWALAYCHIRGGGERGLSWHRQARVAGKQKGVEDLAACLRHLLSLGVSAPSITALTACSAGAVPVAALCNRHPSAMRAVALQAPFLDVLGTMEDSSLPLTLEDRDEWGDPVGDPLHRHVIASYCPLQNITPQRYPSMLLTAYSGDVRVPLAGVLKFSEQLKEAVRAHISSEPQSELKTRPNIVLNVQPGASHLGPEDFELMLEEEALKLAFLYTELNLDPPRPSRGKKRWKSHQDQE